MRKAQLKGGVGGGSVGKVSSSLGELAKPFKLGGTLARPSLAIDTTQALTTIGKAVGGVLLLGPAGILTTLASTAPGDPNACLTAIESAKKKGKAGAGEKPGKEKGVEGEVKEGVKGIEEGIKGLFKK